MHKRIISILLSIILCFSTLAIFAPLSTNAVSTNWAWPTSITSIRNDWPTYSGGGYHGGTDFPVSANSPVYSTCDGEVVAVTSLTTSYGKHIKIRATVNGETVYMRYCHLNGFSVSVGERVYAGQQIGISGSTGNSTGPHLHYEVRNANDYYGNASSPNLNPRNYLPGSGYAYETWETNNFPGEEDTSWVVGKVYYANCDLNTYNQAGVQESGRWIDAGDDCYIDKVYKNGYAWVEYPSGSTRRWAYTLASGFSLEPKDSSAPSISNITVSGISTKGFRVTCKVSDDSGVALVRFPTWTAHNGQDDLGEWPVANIVGDSATLYIKASDHNNETGKYIVHIYARDNMGNERSAGVEISELTDTPALKGSFSLNGNTYYVYNSGKSWSKAKAWCEEHGGHLATVTSAQEWNAVKNALRTFNGTRCWLGADNTSGSWKWVTGESFSFTDWDKNQPDNGGGGTEHYLGSHGDTYLDCFKWNDCADSVTYIGGFVCEFENDSTPQLSETVYYKGHTYEIYNARYTWDKAKEWCEQKGGHLATFTSNYEWKYLKELITAKENMNYWLGAEATSGSWKWVTGESFGFNQWGLGQPDNSGGNEKYLGSYYTNNDKDCIWNDFTIDYSGMTGFVCEYDGTAEPQKILEFTINDHNYEVYNANMNWTQSKKWCEENDGYLVVITDESEWNTIKSNLSDNLITRCWLGASSTSGKWEWVNGEEFFFNNWAESQPDNANGTEHYLGTFGTPLFSTYSWNDYTLSADEIGTFVLEREPEPVPEYIVGDVNGDDSINMKDIVYLQQYMNGWGNTINEKTADVNNDGKVNMKDIVLLQQYMNGWDVSLG